MKIEIKKYVDSITRYAAALAVAVCSLALTQSVHAQASPSIEKKSLKILGIGNSFLKNATNMLPGIVKDSGHELILGVAAPGGRTIQNHYEAALLGEANPEDPKAKLYEYNKQKMTLKEMLTAEKWDYVTIQQSSPNSFKIDTYRPYCAEPLRLHQESIPHKPRLFSTRLGPGDRIITGKIWTKNLPDLCIRSSPATTTPSPKRLGLRKLFPSGMPSNWQRKLPSGNSREILISTTTIQNILSFPKNPIHLMAALRGEGLMAPTKSSNLMAPMPAAQAAIWRPVCGMSFSLEGTFGKSRGILGFLANGPHRFVNLPIRLSTAPARRLGLLTLRLNRQL